MELWHKKKYTVLQYRFDILVVSLNIPIYATLNLYSLEATIVFQFQAFLLIQFLFM